MNANSTNNEMSVNPVEGSTDEARTTARNAEAATADGAEAAASATSASDANETDDEAADEAHGTEDEGRQVRATDLGKLDPDALVRAMTAVGTIRQNAAEHLNAIREDVAFLDEIAADRNEADKAKQDTWQHTLAVVGMVAEATQDFPEFRELVYSYVMTDFFKDEKRTTAKAYASTGKAVLVKLMTDQNKPMEEISTLKYSEVRAALRPAPTADEMEATRLRDEIKERVTFIARYAGKYGGRDSTLTRLQRLHDAVTAEWNPVKAGKDADSREAKAAREIADLRQQSPRENSQTETTAATDKPEVYRRADNRQRRTFEQANRATH